MVVHGVVERGKRLGRELGFNTANVRPLTVEGPWPPDGVYAAAFWIEGEDGARLCMLNQGVHPTAPEGKPTIEAHILDFDGDLYGRAVRVEYLRFLRRERRFPGLDALVEQMGRDREAVRDWQADALAGRDASPEGRRAAEIRWAPGA